MTPSTAPPVVLEQSHAAVPKAPFSQGPTGDVVKPKNAVIPALASTPSAMVVTPDDVKERILALVAEKTGYPADMLDLDLDLEADLGVDTVKQAEVFAAVRETYGIQRDETIKLRDFPTLAHMIGFVRDRRTDLKVQAPALAMDSKPAPMSIPSGAQIQVSAPKSAKIVAPIATPVSLAAPISNEGTGDPVRERVLGLVVDKTGYPRDMLDLDLDLEADLGVDTVKQAEMFAAIREIYSIPREDSRKLRDYPTLAHVIRFVYEKRPDLAAPRVAPATTATPAPVVTEGTAPISLPERFSVSSSVPADALTDDIIKEKVLNIVAEKTGYPVDMLDLELDLEADLGIDTVKQAEMFASVRATFNIPRDADLKLRDFPTLAHVIKFAHDRRPGAAVSGQSTAEKITPAEAAAASESVRAPRPALASLESANRVPRRVPIPVLRPPLSMCKPTGMKLESGQRVVDHARQRGSGRSPHTTPQHARR